MGSKILIVAATGTEAGSIEMIRGITRQEGVYRFADLTIDLLVTGVGGISTSWALKNWFDNNPKPSLAVNIGIAGSFNDCYKQGDVVMPVTECFADLGLEDGENGFISVFNAGLMPTDEFPFSKGCIKADLKLLPDLSAIVPFVKGVTVNTASGTAATIERIKNNYNPDIETMEGATFFYICAMEKVPFIALRAVSNKVEPRNKSNWNIPLALKNLAGRMEEILLILK